MKKTGNTQNLIKLKGQLERVTYENDENSYVVARVKVYGYSDLVTIIGNIPSPTPGEVLSMLGQWQSHPKFGNQFKVVLALFLLQHMESKKYFGSGLIKGIGPIMAKRIVKIFALLIMSPHCQYFNCIFTFYNFVY